MGAVARVASCLVALLPDQPHSSGRLAVFFRRAIPARDHAASRVMFLRLMGLIYLIAILSWWVQMPFLVGQKGLLPAHELLASVEARVDLPWLHLPTLFWINSSDTALHLGCGLGVVAAVLLMTGWFPGPASAVLWLVYLSLVNTGGIFMGYQWDSLLLEAGFLCILLAPWHARRIRARTAPPMSVHSTLALWSVWFLLAKLMWFSGWVKLAWGDPAWWPERNAMTFHYLTQPIPTWTAWFVHQLPAAIHKASLWPMYFIELVLPWAILLGRPGRRLAACGTIALMLLIMATGNYGWFNCLVIVLCVPLADDVMLRWLRLAPHDSASGSAVLPEMVSRQKPSLTRGLWWQIPRLAAIGLVGIANGLVCYVDTRRGASHEPDESFLPARIATALSFNGGFRLANSYGLFRIMTTDRPEIVIEGSSDGTVWEEYRLRWKPGEVSDKPVFTTPHMPRLAWQFWFFALERSFQERSRNAGWFAALLSKLLDGDPVARSWFEEPPFPETPPRYLRCRLYLYEFTNPSERELTAAWWKRRDVGTFLGVVGRRTPS